MKFTSLEVTPPLGTPVVVQNHNFTLSVAGINALRFEDDKNLEGPVIAGNLVYSDKSHFFGCADDNTFLVTEAGIKVAVACVLKDITKQLSDDFISLRAAAKLNELLLEYINVEAVTARLIKEAKRFTPLSSYYSLRTELFCVNPHQNSSIERGPVRKIVHTGEGIFSYETDCRQHQALYFPTIDEALDAVAKSLRPHLALVRDQVKVVDTVSESEGRRMRWFSGD